MNGEAKYFFSDGTKLSKGVCILIHPTMQSKIDCIFNSLRAGSLVWTGSLDQELARRMGRGKVSLHASILIFEFPAFADERSDPIGLN